MSGNRTMRSDEQTSNCPLRCAIYTRKSTEEGLNQEFNTLEAQREAAEAYVASQWQLGWVLLAERYDDGGYTGANLERPALRRPLEDIERGTVGCVLVYKIDRLSRSLLDFARLIEVFERHHVSLVSVTQPLNTTASLRRLTLNILLSFAQFERETISDRTRDKMAAARRKGKWVGGTPVLGYDIAATGSRLLVNPLRVIPAARRVGNGSGRVATAAMDDEKLAGSRWHRTRRAAIRESRTRAAASKRTPCWPGRAPRRVVCGRTKSHRGACCLGAGATATWQSAHAEQIEEAPRSPEIFGRATRYRTSTSDYAAAGPGAQVRGTNSIRGGE
jgi:DNA invertase Pin-like site-specific DNA recombinase